MGGEAPAVSGGLNWLYSNSKPARSLKNVLHSAALLGMVTLNIAVQTIPGASGSPTSMTVVRPAACK